MDIKPITREEMYLAKAAGQDVSLPEPITRKEMFLAKIAGMEVETPGAITRIEMFANKAAVALNRSVIEPLEITENGTYTAPEGVDGYNPVTVEVVGSGGGSGGGLLPAGVYWEQIKGTVPYYQKNYHFSFNGKIYLITDTAAASASTWNVRKIYKYENGTYTEVTSYTDPYIDGSPSCVAVEYNGKMHFMAPERNVHKVWSDGTKMTALNDMPANVYKKQSAVYNGELYILAQNGLYKWDEMTDTWESVITTLPSNLESFYLRILFVVNGTMYAGQGANIYEFVNGTFILKKTLPVDLSAIFAVLGNCIYFRKDSVSVAPLYKYDFLSDVFTEVGLAPYAYSSRMDNINNQLWFMDGCNEKASNLIMHEVTE